MKKLLSIILSIAMVCAMCVGVTALATTGSGTKADPYVVSSWTEFSAVIDSAPTDNMTGTPTYIRLSGNLSDDNIVIHAINSGKNIDLDLNQHTLKCLRFDLVSAKLNIHNGTVQSNDAAAGYASYALGAFNAELTADGVTFRGGSGIASGVTGGYGLQIVSSTLFVKNCTVISGDSFSDASCQRALFITSSSTGTISNTTLTRGAGLENAAQSALRITEDCTVTDGDGNPLTSSGINEELVVIPASSRDLPITEVDGTKSTDVKGTYVAGVSADTVYSVDVAWGSMVFTYTAASEGTWNPATHSYDDAEAGGWSDTNNTITVTNHSNAAIDATLTYTAVTAYSAITGAFTEDSGTANDGKLELATAAGTEVDAAPTATAALTLKGALAEGVTNTKIGAVTITIAAHTSGTSVVDGQDGGSYGRV